MILHQHLGLIVFLNLLLLSYNNFSNKHNVLSYITIPLTSWSCSNVIISSYIIFCWLAKKIFSINYNILIIYFYSWRNYRLWFDQCSLFKNNKTKSLFTPWKLGLIKWSKFWFYVCIVAFYWYLFQSIVFLKPCFFIDLIFLHCLESIRLQLDYRVLYQLL